VSKILIDGRYSDGECDAAQLQSFKHQVDVIEWELEAAGGELLVPVAPTGLGAVQDER